MVAEALESQRVPGLQSNGAAQGRPARECWMRSNLPCTGNIAAFAMLSAEMWFSAAKILKKGSTVHTSLVKDSLDQLEGNFVTEKGKSVTLDEIKSHGDYKMLYVDFDTTVKVEGKVTYISDNVTVESDNTVTTTSGQGSIIIFH